MGSVFFAGKCARLPMSALVASLCSMVALMGMTTLLDACQDPGTSAGGGWWKGWATRDVTSRDLGEGAEPWRTLEFKQLIGLPKKEKIRAKKG